MNKNTVDIYILTVTKLMLIIAVLLLDGLNFKLEVILVSDELLY